MSSETPAAAATDDPVWDLTTRLAPFLDRHMMFPLLEFVEQLVDTSGHLKYAKTDIVAARYALSRPTRMVDYTLDCCTDDSQRQELEALKQTVYQQRSELQQQCQPLVDIVQNTELVAQLQASGQWNVAGLQQAKNLALTPDQLSSFRQLARWQYDCGDYQQARDMLTHYMALFAHPPNTAAGGAGAGGDDDDEYAAGVTSTANNNNNASDANAVTGNPAVYHLFTMSHGNTPLDPSMVELLWGKLASEIMAQDWKAATVAVEAVRVALQEKATTTASNSAITTPLDYLQAVQQRTWLLHWSLFVFWNDAASGLEHLMDLWMTEPYKQALTTHAPHLLRYLTAAVLLTKRRPPPSSKKNSKDAAATPQWDARRLLRTLTHVMQDTDYTDPLVDFVASLTIQLDLERAQTSLAACPAVLESDFFLCKQTDVFLEEARVFFLEQYCRIHTTMDLKALPAHFFGPAGETKGEEDGGDSSVAERWMVDWIRHSDLPAMVQSDGCVVMAMEPLSMYEQVMDRTRDWTVRSATLLQTLQTRLTDARKEHRKRQLAAREE